MAAIASIAGHVVNTVVISPPREPVLFLLFLTLPSIRVLAEREDNRYLTYLHWLWIFVWLVPGAVIVAALVDPRSSGVKQLPGVVLIAAIAAGFYASVAYLRRPRAR